MSSSLYTTKALIAVAAASLFSSPAQAQTTPAPAAADSADSTGLGDIIVTAQKREENLQKTPIAISVLGSQDLVNRRVVSLLDLGDGAIPSLKVAPFFSRQSALIISVRGIGVLADSNQPARDQGVGVYVDGIYLGRAQGLGTALFDVQSIEVLKGPQGTLFGRNTEGGAVSIITKRPSGVFKLNATAGVGNFGSYKGELHLDLPEYSGLSFKLDAVVAKRDGLIDNPLEGASDFNGYDRRGIRGSALWKPVDGFSATYAYDNSYDATTPLYQHTIAIGSLARAPLLPIEGQRVSTATTGVPLQPSIGKTYGHSLIFDWQATPNLLIKSINSLRKLNQSQYDNGGASGTAYIPSTANPTPTFARYSLAFFDQRQYSTELQAIGDLPRLKYAVGAIYYNERVQDSAQAFNTNQFNVGGTATTILSLVYANQRIDRASKITTESLGLFGQATYNPAVLDDRFNLTVGARWTRDKKAGQLFTVNGGIPNVDGVIAPRTLDRSWSRVDPLVTLAFEATPDVNVYGKWSSGYRSGGANSRSLRYAPFNPETVSMFEIGAKTEFLDKRVRFNVAAYTGTYKDIQLDFFANYIQRDANGNLVQTNRTTSETTNAPGSGQLRGVELDFALAPTTGLTLTGNYAYNYVSIPATSNPFPQGANGTIVATPIVIYPVYTPRNSASGAIDYEVPLDNFALRFHLDANYGDGFFANNNDPQQEVRNAAGVVTQQRILQPKGDSAFIVNGRFSIADIGLGESGAKASLSVWARNLFNEQHLFVKLLSPLTGTSGFFNDPRTFGVELNTKF